MADLIRAEESQRIDLDDWKAVADSLPQAVLRNVGKGALAPQTGTRSFVFGGFGVTNPTAKDLRVDIGQALLSQREAGVAQPGNMVSDGDAFRTIDLTSYSVGVYGVYIRLEYADGVFQNRIFWNDVANVEFSKSIATRRQSNWGLRVELLSPGAEWTKIAEVSVAAGPPLVVKKTRDLYFEGTESADTANAGAAATLGAPAAGEVPVTGLTGMSPTSVGRYLRLPNGTGNNKGLHRITTYTSAAAVSIDDKGGLVLGAEGPIAWAETDAFRPSWGTAADRTDDRAVGIADFHTFAQMVTQKLQEIQTGNNIGDVPGFRWWEATADSLDNKLSLNGNVGQKTLGSLVLSDAEQIVLPSSGDDFTLGDSTIVGVGFASISLAAGGITMATGSLAINGPASSLTLAGSAGMNLTNGAPLNLSDGQVTFPALSRVLGNVLPNDATGQVLGANANRWDAYLRHIYVSGTVRDPLIPATGSLDLGTSGAPWRALYAYTVDVASVLDMAAAARVTGDLVPTGAAQDLGSIATSWANVFVDDIYMGANEKHMGPLGNEVILGESAAGKGAQFTVLGGDTITGAFSHLLRLQTDYAGAGVAVANALTGVALYAEDKISMLEFDSTDAEETGVLAPSGNDTPLWLAQDRSSGNSGAIRVILKGPTKNMVGWIRVWGTPA